jgi:16S rRNA (cytosine1402-N4)-methyltransferase
LLQDEDALANALPDDYRANENFRFHQTLLCVLLIEKCRWVLADLGVSSINLMWLNVVFYCFSIGYENESKNDLNAYRVVNEYDEADLKRVF